MKRFICGLFLVLILATVAMCATDAFDTLSDYISLSDSLKGGSSGGGGGGRGGGSSGGGRGGSSGGGGRGGSSSGGRGSGGRGSSSGSGRTSGGRSTGSVSGGRVSGPGRSPTGLSKSIGGRIGGRVSGPGRSPTGPSKSIGRVSGPGRAPTSVSIQRNAIQNRINAAFAGLNKVNANPALSAALSRYASMKAASLKAPSLFSKAPLGPLSTFSKVNPSLPTNKFTKPATVANLPANVPVPQARPANLAKPATTPQTVATATTVKNPINPAGVQRVTRNKELTGTQVAQKAIKELTAAGVTLSADPKQRIGQIADQMANPGSLHKCAGYVAAAVEAATGVSLSRPASKEAKDYGTTMTKAGMKSIPNNSTPQVGDVRVIGASPTNAKYSIGHMEVYSGPKSGWVSDFAQGVSAADNPKSAYHGAAVSTYRF